MAVGLEDRMAQLNSLNDFIDNSRKRITSILSILGWDEDSIKQKSREMVTCPLNSEHYVPADNLQKHVTSCSWRMEGYSEQDIPLPESCASDASGIAIDKEMRTAIIREAAMQDPKMKTGIPAVGLDDRPIPKTMDRIICDFTPDERRVLYDFAVSKNKTPPVMKVEEFHMPFQKEEQKRPKTFIERLAEERDAKRRKVSKKVHTNRKSYVEIMREVIQNQMELYEEFQKQENEEFRIDADKKSHKEYDFDRDQLDSESTSIVAHASKKNSLQYKERYRHDQKEFKKHGHSRSVYRTETEPGRSHLKHEDPHRFQQDRWERKSEYDRRDGNSSHRDRYSKNQSGTVRETSDRHHKNKYTHSHRREEASKSKRRHRTHSSLDNSEDVFHKRKRSRDEA